jgi:hypothetical protein
MAYFGKRCYPTFLPDGTPGSCQSFVSTAPPTTSSTPPTGFVLNGLPLGSQPGAPFADPAVDDSGNAISINPVTHKQRLRVYKAAAIQQDVTLNKKGWHSPQQRIMTLISLSDADRSVSQPDRYRRWSSPLFTISDLPFTIYQSHGVQTPFNLPTQRRPAPGHRSTRARPQRWIQGSSSARDNWQRKDVYHRQRHRTNAASHPRPGP